MKRKKTSNELTEDEQREVDLENLKIQILECKQNVAENTINLGKYLYNAKEQLQHGKWGKWLEEEIDFSERTARRYINVYKKTIELDEKYDKTVKALNSSQLIEISKLKKDDIENLLDNENVKDMSVRELEKVIKSLKTISKKKSKSDNVDRFVETPTTLVVVTDISEIWEDTVILNKELHMRANSDEDLETTLVARYQAKEITHQELSDIIVANKLNLPIFFNEKSLEDYLDRFNNDFYSSYEQYDFEADKREDRTYYSIFARELEWKEAIKCWDEEDEYAIDWGKSNHSDNGTYQLAESYIDTSKYLCIYKDYKLLGTFLDGNISDIERLGTYDRKNIPVESLNQLKALYEQLQEQMQEYDKRSQKRDEKHKKEYAKKQKQQEKYRQRKESWKTYYQPYSMGKWNFEDIWDENGEVKNYKLWNEMTTFCNEQRAKQNDNWKNYDFGNLFGNKVPSIKEEDKPQYKRLYRILAKQCHPDIAKDDGALMQLTNKLKEQWGI